MFTGNLKVGDALVWRHTQPEAYARVEVERVIDYHPDADNLVRITDGRGWHIEMHERFFQKHCMRGMGWPKDFAIFPKTMREWWEESKTAAAQSPEDLCDGRENPGEPNQD